MFLYTKIAIRTLLQKSRKIRNVVILLFTIFLSYYLKNPACDVIHQSAYYLSALRYVP